MNNIITGHVEDKAFSSVLIESMYRLRHDVFKGRLDWDVTSIDGQEKDLYDNLNPVYMMSCNMRKQLEGCWRLLPTTGPYMLKDIFPQLLRGEAVPEAPDIWELSRLAVQPRMNHSRIKANLNEITLDMFREVYDFAVANNISRYVVVTSAAIERMLRLVGIPTSRFGDGKLTRIGKVLSVCVWVDINDRFRQAVYGPIEDQRKAA